MNRARARPWLLLLLCAGLAACAEPAPVGEQRTSVRLGGEAFMLEIAATPGARRQGLSGRAHELESHEGMLFIFPRPQRPTFVMRGCAAPLDLLLLDGSGRIVTQHRMRVEPPGTPEASLTRYSSRWPVQFGIEVPGGTLDRLGLEPGDRIELPGAQLLARAK